MYRCLCCRSFLEEIRIRQDGGSSLKLVLCMLDYNEWSSHPKTKKPRKKKWGLSSLLLIVFAGPYNVSILKFAAAQELVFHCLIGLYLSVWSVPACTCHTFKMLTSHFLLHLLQKRATENKFEEGKNVDIA